MPYSVRARENAPVAVPIDWDELSGIESGGHWHIGDASVLIERAGTSALKGWGFADQTLPSI